MHENDDAQWYTTSYLLLFESLRYDSVLTPSQSRMPLCNTPLNSVLTPSRSRMPLNSVLTPSRSRMPLCNTPSGRRGPPPCVRQQHRHQKKSPKRAEPSPSWQQGCGSHRGEAVHWSGDSHAMADAHSLQMNESCMAAVLKIVYACTRACVHTSASACACACVSACVLPCVCVVCVLV